jgi:transposase
MDVRRSASRIGEAHPERRGVERAGVGRARALIVELAWMWLRHQPGSALAQWHKAREGGAKGRVAKIAIVALARKPLIALWRFVKDGVVPEGATMKVAPSQRNSSPE